MIKSKSVQQRRDIKRRQLVDDRRRQRALRKAQSLNFQRSVEERQRAKKQLDALPRDSASVRLVNRCVETGRGRSVITMFRRSRYVIRDRMRNGELPGFTKASW